MKTRRKQKVLVLDKITSLTVVENYVVGCDRCGWCTLVLIIVNVDDNNVSDGERNKKKRKNDHDTIEKRLINKR